MPFVNLGYDDGESISYLVPKIWDVVPPQPQQNNSLNGFEKLIRKWITVDCPCSFCRNCSRVEGFMRNCSVLKIFSMTAYWQIKAVSLKNKL